MIDSIYRISILLLQKIIPILANLGVEKLRIWHTKRSHIWAKIDSLLAGNQAPLIWVHVSSRGETEQALPLIQLLKKRYPTYKVFLTIFSPSGERTLEEVDFITYLPLDTPANAKRLVERLNPKLVIWVKYDFWYFYLKYIHAAKIPLILISSIFTPAQFTFFKKRFYKKILSFFTHIHVQNEASKNLLAQNKIHNVYVSGDTRFDRVLHLSQTLPKPNFSFIPSEQKILICGSIYPSEYRMLQYVATALPNLYLILVPHHVHKKNIQQLVNHFPKAQLYSKMNDKPPPHNAIIIDEIGLLMSLYAVSDYCYVGGGFDKGIHNILEPASFGKVVLFGPRFQNYQEAVAMHKLNLAYNINNEKEFIQYIKQLQHNPQEFRKLSEAIKGYIANNSNVAKRILQVCTFLK